MQATGVWLAIMAPVVLLLAGCDNSQTPLDAGAARPPGLAYVLNTQQSEIEKYNAYVKAAGHGIDFLEILGNRRARYYAQLASENPLAEYSLFTDQDFRGLHEKLTKALAWRTPVPEVDEPAEVIVAALERLEPIYRELALYADSKGYLADGGQKARDREPALDNELLDLGIAQARFLIALDIFEQTLTQRAFDEAEKDSTEYYRAGVALHAKQSL